MHNVRHHASEAIKALLDADKERAALDHAAHQAIRDIALFWDDRSTHPGYSWCILHEERK